MNNVKILTHKLPMLLVPHVVLVSDYSVAWSLIVCWNVIFHIFFKLTLLHQQLLKIKYVLEDSTNDLVTINKIKSNAG
jgi:hypothetical protein